MIAVKNEKPVSIGTAAEATNTTVKMLRYWEEKGYISPKRNGTQRVYVPADRTSLRLILRGKRLGLSLEETAEMIRMYGEPGGNRKQLKQFISRIGEKRAELERKRLDLEKMLADLQHVEDRARAALGEYGD